jgi:glutamate-ammonia-ligase adenylyltransferase
VFRLMAQDLAGRLTVERVSDHLSELADRVLGLAIELVWATLRLRFRETPRFAAVAYGRLGGKELGYTSDLDLVFLYDDDDERAPEAYAHLAQRLSGWLSARTAAGLLFEIDLRLRPNGAAGMLVSRLAAFEAYQRESAWVWEHQALTRARFSAGDREIGERFEEIRRAALSQRRELPKLRDEVIAMRRKMHEGHPNRSELFDLKHDRGGMVDIEFLVQYLVLGHSCDHPTLLDNAGNIALLGRAAACGLVDAGLATRTADAYRRYRRLQHQLKLDDAAYARVEPGVVAAEREAVTGLWDAVLGTR